MKVDSIHGSLYNVSYIFSKGILLPYVVLDGAKMVMNALSVSIETVVVVVDVDVDVV